eukprot:1071912-Prymnesium_polylepis.1
MNAPAGGPAVASRVDADMRTHDARVLAGTGTSVGSALRIGRSHTTRTPPAPTCRRSTSLRSTTARCARARRPPSWWSSRAAVC